MARAAAPVCWLIVCGSSVLETEVSFPAAGLRLRLGCTLERAGGIVLLWRTRRPESENRTVKTLLSSLSLWLALSASAFAGDMRLTIYDDGISCPGNCDSHVVMNTADNGTRHAYRPDSSRRTPPPAGLARVVAQSASAMLTRAA